MLLDPSYTLIVINKKNDAFLYHKKIVVNRLEINYSS